LLTLLVLTTVWLLRRSDKETLDGAVSGEVDAGREPTRAMASADESGTPPAGPGKRSERGTNRAGSARSDGPVDSQDPIDGDGPDVIRSQVRAMVPVGQSMVTGGHRLADGSHEFAVITPKWMETPNGSKMIEMEVELLKLDAAALMAAGLETLVSGERKSEQNAEVWTPEELARTMKDVDKAALQSKPRVIVSPGSPARITVGAGRGEQLNLELEASEAADGAFDLKSDLKRVE
jgi:hypothetical protein